MRFNAINDKLRNTKCFHLWLEEKGVREKRPLMHSVVTRHYKYMSKLRYIKEILSKLQKEKPKMILSEEKILAFKQLTNKEIAEMKAKEEEAFEEMVQYIMDQ